MHGSNRGAIAAIIGLVIVAIGFGVSVTILTGAEYEQQRVIAANHNASRADNRAQQYLTERSGLPAYVERSISNPEPESGQDHEKRDLAAQEAAATFGWWMVVISGAGVLITFIGTILLYRQITLTQEAVSDTGDATELMRKANELAARQYKDGFKPWLTTKADGTLVTNTHELSNETVEQRKVVCLTPSLYIDVTNHSKMPANIEEVWVFSSDGHPTRARGSYLVLGPNESFRISSTDNPAAAAFTFQYVIMMTPANRTELLQNAPMVRFIIIYSDPIGVKRLMSFAYSPERLWTRGLVRAGGAEMNYERELDMEQGANHERPLGV